MRELASALFISSALAAPTVAFSFTDPVAYYPFSGDAQDRSGYGNDGVVHGAQLTQDRFGNPDRAYHFDGDDFIAVPPAPSLQLTTGLTLAAWVRHDRVSNPQHIVNMSEFRSGYRLAA